MKTYQYIHGSILIRVTATNKFNARIAIKRHLLAYGCSVMILLSEIREV